MYAQTLFLPTIVAFSWLAATRAIEQQVLISPETQHAIKTTGAKIHDISASTVLRQFSHGGCGAGTGFVALGDSYSAGIGTGVEGEEGDCRQGIHAHPQLIAADCGPTAFQFLSCTGAATTNVMVGGEESQLDRFKYASRRHALPAVAEILLLHDPRTPENKSSLCYSWQFLTRVLIARRSPLTLGSCPSAATISASSRS